LTSQLAISIMKDPMDFYLFSAIRIFHSKS